MKLTFFHKIQQNWPFFMGLIIVVMFFALPIVGFELSHFPGDLGDGRFNNYMLEHSYLFLCLLIILKIESSANFSSTATLKG